VKADTKKEKYEKIAAIKCSTPVEELCKGFPGEHENIENAQRFKKYPQMIHLFQLIDLLLF